MNTDERIEKIYKSTFREVHASDELKGMVENMANKKYHIRKNAWKKVAAAALVFTFLFGFGNIAAYAATGDSLITYVTVKISGSEVNMEEDIKLEKKVDENGDVYYYGHFKEGNEERELEVTSDVAEGSTDFTVEAKEYTGDNDDNSGLNEGTDIGIKHSDK